MEQAYFERYYGKNALNGWSKAATTRISIRHFAGEANKEQNVALAYQAEKLALPGVKMVLGRCADNFFSGPVPMIQRFDNARECLAVYTDVKAENGLFYAGIAAAAFVLEAWQNKVASCIVTGSYKKRDVPSYQGYTPVCMIALGSVSPFPDTLEPLRRRRAIEKMCDGLETFPQWAQQAAHLTQQAPSAMNQQPWKMTMQEHQLCLWAKENNSVDAGIAALYLCAAVNNLPHSTFLFENGPIVRIQKE